ncbi:MAG: hypothetical protein AAGC44_05260 [Planctomycetota bacterium]
MTISIDKDSRISLGLMLTLTVPMLWIAVKVHKIEAKQAQAYTITQASEDALREAIANPGHKVPDPRDPGQLIVVEQTRHPTGEDDR